MEKNELNIEEGRMWLIREEENTRQREVEKLIEGGFTERQAMILISMFKPRNFFK